MQSAIKKNFLIFNLATDEDDPVLGFCSSLIGRIAQEAACVHVITVRTGAYRALPRNVFVYSVGRERGRGRLASLIFFYKHLFSIIWTHPIDICFAHMNSLFVVLASPFLWILNIPIIIWHSHRKKGLMMRIAHYCAWRIITSTPEAYASSDPKVIVTGHMIDTARFYPMLDVKKESPLLFISVGRISPIKDLATFVRAAAIMRDAQYAIQCVCIGPVLSSDISYFNFLKNEIDRYGLGDAFIFKEPVHYERIAREYRSAFAHINLCATGSLDKAVLESMACGTPSVFANTAYRAIAGSHTDRLLFDYGNAESLASLLMGLITLPEHAMHAMRMDLQGAIITHASMDSFMAQFWKIISLQGSRP